MVNALKTGPTLKDGGEGLSISNRDVDFLTYPKRQLPDLLSKLKDPRYYGHSVIVCWSHQQLSVIAKELGAENVPDKWPKSRYDLVWVLQLESSGKVVKFEQLAQRLMFGDLQ